MDGCKTQKHEKKQNRFFLGLGRGLRFYYRCYLVHFVLALAGTAVLFLLVLGTKAAFGDGGTVLWQSVYSGYKVTARPRAEKVSALLLGTSVYLDGTSYIDTLRPTLPADREETESGEVSGTGTQESNTPPSTDAPLDTEILDAGGKDLYAYSYSVPRGHLAVLPIDLSGTGRYTEENGGILVSNQTSYDTDVTAFAKRAYPIAPADVETGGEGIGAAPLVLILHTHGTEAYAPDGALSVEEDVSFRSSDTEQNVVSVGAVLAQTLRRCGIPTLHCETMFDYESYEDSYKNAAAYIQKTLSAYPSIVYVFDVHRDALYSGDGDILRPVTEISGEVTAQVMTVVGTDEASDAHEGWRNNLTVAVHLQKALISQYESFVRPINLRAATFNAQYAPGSLLLEIGSAGNSVEEARSAAYRLGVVLAELILAGG